MRVITYDLETLKTIEEAGGWDRHDKLGVSVVCCHVSDTNNYFVFSDQIEGFAPWATLYEVESVRSFGHLAATADRLVGFNNLRFDNEVLRRNGGAPPARLCYDILLETWIAQGLPLDRYDKATHSGSLNDYARANLGIEKSSSGELAPVMWKEGRFREVIEYCLLDVRITRALYDLIQSRGYLDNPKTQKRVFFPNAYKEFQGGE